MLHHEQIVGLNGDEEDPVFMDLHRRWIDKGARVGVAYNNVGSSNAGPLGAMSCVDRSSAQSIVVANNLQNGIAIYVYNYSNYIPCMLQFGAYVRLV